MQLTLYTDYSLRVLLYLGLNTRRVATITDIAESYGISRNHLVKVVHNLSVQGFIQSARGRGGGLTLARTPNKINIGDVVRHTEMNFDLVECFDLARNTCPIAAACFLKVALSEAQHAFMGVLDRYTLADVLDNGDWLRSVLKVPSPEDAD
jgi:Rrf2 family nitric oxide-sensitive transcriptional repressor